MKASDLRVSDANIFADCKNVGQLFDALWYNATKVVLASVPPEVTFTEYRQRARELAIGDAHKRYQELTDG